jgi:hypothetical protein
MMYSPGDRKTLSWICGTRNRKLLFPRLLPDQSHPTSGNGMAHLEFGPDRLTQPHPLQGLELG